MFVILLTEPLVTLLLSHNMLVEYGTVVRGAQMPKHTKTQLHDRSVYTVRGKAPKAYLHHECKPLHTEITKQ